MAATATSLSLSELAARVRPVSPVGTRILELPPSLASLFAEGGIRRGTTVGVGPLAGGCSVALAVAAEVTGRGGWVAAVGLPSLGLAAAEERGVDLGRLALVPRPGERWATVVAALVDGFELLVCRPEAVKAVEARRLAARVRERSAVLMLLDPSGWPEPVDLWVTVERPEWEGLGDGHGHLRAGRSDVVVGGRRAGGRDRRVTLRWPVPETPPVPAAPAENAVAS